VLRIRILLLGLLLFGIAGVAAAQQDFVVGPLTTQAAACPVSPGQQSASTSALTLATMNAGGATFTIGASPFSGTVSFFGSADGALTWAPLNVFPSNSTTPVTTATAAGVWQVNVAAYTNVCMVFTTATSGTVTATIRKATVSARAGGGGGGGAAPVFPQTVSGTVTSGGIPYFNSATSESSSGILNAGVLVQGGGAGGAPTNSLCDNGVTTANTLTCTDTGGIAAPGFIGTGTGAGFDALVQGADNCVAKQPAGSVCWEAPASGVTSYHGLYAVTPSTGIPHYSYSAPTITETISAIVGADCPTCVTSAAAITNNVLPKGSGGAQGVANSLATDDGTTLSYTGTGGVESPVFEATGTTAGFMAFAQGTTSAAVDPCNIANTICIQAPISVTGYLINLAGAASTGIPHYVNAANVITETITPIVAADLPAKINGSCAPVASAVAVTSSNPTINTDQNLIQLSIPAGCFNTLSQPFEINGGGIYSSTAASSPVLTFRIKLCTISGCGSGTVVTLGSWVTPALNTTAITNATYNIVTTAVTSAIGTTGTLALKGNLTLDTGALVSTPDVVIADANIAVSATIDLTAALFIDFTIAQSVVGASNSYTQMLGMVR
jgi:hypothetical protein